MPRGSPNYKKRCISHEVLKLSCGTHLLDGGDVVGRDVASHDDVLELEVLARLRVLLHGFDVTNDASVLTRTACLLLMRVVVFGAFLDRLAICHLRLAGRALDVVFAAHTLDVDLEMELAHT